MKMSCECCWKEVLVAQMGTVKFPNGRAVSVCNDCLNDLWHLHDRDRVALIEDNDPELEAIKRRLTEIERRLDK